MDKTERVKAALRGEAVDRVPVSFWGHVYDREDTADGLAESMLAFNRTYDWDFIKVQARASYHGEIWGGEYSKSPDGVTPPGCTRAVLNSPADWAKIEVKAPDAGVLGEQLQALRQINAAVAGQVPVIQTVFAPLTVAYYLCGQDAQKLKQIILRDTTAAKQGLSNIAKTFKAHMPLCIDAGACGFFYSLSFGPSRDYMTEDEYADLARPSDLEALEAIPPHAYFMMLHICKTNIMFDLVQDYPVHCYNWSVMEVGNPSVAEVLRKTDKAVVGGMPEKQYMVDASEAELQAQVRQLLDVSGGRRLLLGGGCSQTLQLVPEGSFRAIKAECLSYPSGTTSQL
jgi:uroporphyrinogen decarboxylase